jgi:hypothetical protein
MTEFVYILRSHYWGIYENITKRQQQGNGKGAGSNKKGTRRTQYQELTNQPSGGGEYWLQKTWNESLAQMGTANCGDDTILTRIKKNMRSDNLKKLQARGKIAGRTTSK